MTTGPPTLDGLPGAGVAGMPGRGATSAKPFFRAGALFVGVAGAKPPPVRTGGGSMDPFGACVRAGDNVRAVAPPLEGDGLDTEGRPAIGVVCVPMLATAPALIPRLH